MGRSLVFCIALLCCAFLWISCASDSAKDNRKPLKTTTCKYWLQKCHYKARSQCPSGYSVSRSTRVDKIGGPQGSYKEFTMIFYCH
jgi:hypothetical protein